MNTRRKLAPGIALIVIGVLAISMFIRNPDQNSPAPAWESVASGANLRSEVPGAQQQTIVHLASSWARGYTDLRELTADAALVVHARVTGPGEVVDGEGRAPISTRFPVEVLDVAKGDVPVGAMLYTMQLGAETPDLVRVSIEDPFLVPGGEYILFLAERDPTADAHYIQGGPKGRMIVTNDRASSLSHALAMPESFTDLGFEDIPVPEMLALVREHRDATPMPFPSRPVYGQ